MASPHKFRFDPLWKDSRWAGQRIVDGLPILATSLDRAGQHCEVEQFAAVLSEDAPLERGEVPSVLMTRMKFSGRAGLVEFGLRIATENPERHLEVKEVADRTCVVDRETGNIWLMFDANSALKIRIESVGGDEKNPEIELACAGELPVNESLDVSIKLASPTLPKTNATLLASLDHGSARAATVNYWESWLSRGASFEVPEDAVNDLFRANLWHALVLPRHRTDDQNIDRIDLPYSNLAYGQYNADWPINQAVYVDYMIHGLRGYFPIADEEFAAIYQTQQKEDGRVGGFAEWGVYTPSMLYSIGQNFLLSNDRGSFERLLPQSLKALDWCLSEIEKGEKGREVPGVIVAPLNDLTHESRAWGFPNAYFVAGLEVFARAWRFMGIREPRK